MLARGEHDAPERDHACVFDRVPDYGVGLGAGLAVRDDVIRIGEIELVDLLARHELVDLDHALALDRDRFQLLRLDRNVVALALLIALDDVVPVDLASGFGIDLFVLDAVSRLPVQLMEMDFFPLRCRG